MEENKGKIYIVELIGVLPNHEIKDKKGKVLKKVAKKNYLIKGEIVPLIDGEKVTAEIYEAFPESVRDNYFKTK